MTVMHQLRAGYDIQNKLVKRDHSLTKTREQIIKTATNYHSAETGMTLLALFVNECNTNCNVTLSPLNTTVALPNVASSGCSVSRPFPSSFLRTNPSALNH